ncbi:MAG: 3-oxoacyl-ACP synthase III family protein [Halanaerobiales bacterium]
MNQILYNFPQKKRKNINRYCKIICTGSYLPEKIISNDEIIKEYELPFKSTAISNVTGVKTRHVAEGDMVDTDLLSAAAKKCLEKSTVEADSLSRIIVNKYIGDNILPMTASRLQGKLNCNTAVHSFDIDGGISSFLYSIDTASRFINTGDEYILIASGGIVYRLINKNDPRVSFLFGDGSAAVLMGLSKEEHVLASYFYSNYHYYEQAVANGILKVDIDQPSDKDNSAAIFDTYTLGNWKEAEDFYRKAVEVVSENLLEESGLDMDNIDLVLVTENNRKLWELTLETLEIDKDKSISLIESCGNTMSAMLPLLLDHGFMSGKIQAGMNIMLISHGEGLSGGGIVYRV